MLNSDYKDMLQALLENGVKFLLVGAYAMGAHGYPRATGDIDIWVEPSPENSGRVYRSMAAFGAPLHEIDETTFATPGLSGRYDQLGYVIIVATIESLPKRLKARIYDIADLL